MRKFKVLVTCPPMLGMIDNFSEISNSLGIELIPAKVKQTLTEDELIRSLPEFDGWIIGDDPASEKVFESGANGLLKAAVKWGIGIDNVNFNSCKKLNISITNTPAMFGKEVADVSICYLHALARNIVEIDREVRKGNWIKPSGISVAGKTAAIIGFGDIGRNTAKRLLSSDMNIIVYDPFINEETIDDKVKLYQWPLGIELADFIIINCSLTSSSYHMINNETIKLMKKGVRIINVGRGPIIEESALIHNLNNEYIHSVALDVYENEPISLNSPLLNNTRCILGSHNASNTKEAVIRTSKKAIKIISDFLNQRV